MKLNLEAATWHNSLSWQIGMLHCQVYSCKWHFSVERGKIYISPQQFSTVSWWMTPTWSSKDGKKCWMQWIGVCFLCTLHQIPVFCFGWLALWFSRIKFRLGQFSLLGFWFHGFYSHSALKTKQQKNQSSYKGTCCWMLSLLHPLSSCVKGINEAQITNWCL